MMRINRPAVNARGFVGEALQRQDEVGEHGLDGSHLVQRLESHACSLASLTTTYTTIQSELTHAQQKDKHTHKENIDIEIHTSVTKLVEGLCATHAALPASPPPGGLWRLISLKLIYFRFSRRVDTGSSHI